MHLRSLTLKGFKSFAQATTFAFEPGVTCIVGPNGSGKSNVVDALAWVMGEQGAKTLRGGTMADVIFAGTATRGPLGRAEVVLTIDNADGALPIEYGEVAISRTLFRDGRSEYAINGDSCRLLDVQELLSDSGLGREMHVIVGQGQLDAVLRASPEERRGFIEEAAGILKHRRRRERTLRKLDAMQANLTRLTDLADELRRQLKPLGAQAEIAREAAEIQAAVRDSRTRLLAHDAVRLAASVAGLEEEQRSVATARQVAEDEGRLLETRVAALEEASGGAQLDGARRTALELETLQQRFRALAQSAATKIALLAPDDAPPVHDTAAAERTVAADGVQALEQRLEAAEAQRRAAEAALTGARAVLATVDDRIAAGTAAAAEHDRAVAALERTAAGAASRASATEAEALRRGEASAAAADRAEQADRALAEAPPAPAETEDDAAPAERDLRAATEAADAARAALHALERQQSAAEARLAALRAATTAPATVEQVLAALPGARRLQDLVEVDPAWRTAIDAALGALSDAAVVPDDGALRAAAAAVSPLGAVDVVSAEGFHPDDRVPPDTVRAASVVRAPAGVLAQLRGVVLVPDLDAAHRAAGHDGVVAVTRAGELVSSQRIRTAGSATGNLDLAAERDEAEAAVGALLEQLTDARASADGARARQRDVRISRDAIVAAARSRAQAARAAAGRRAAVEARAESARSEAQRAEAQAETARRAAEVAARERDAADRAVATTGDRPAVEEIDRGPAAAAADAARDRALEVRLQVETLRERLAAERRRIDDLTRRADAAERAAEAAARRAAERTVQREAAEEVLSLLPAWQASVDAAVTEARVELAEEERQRDARSADLRAARERAAAARRTLADLDARSRDLDMRLYEQRVSLGSVRDRALAELGLDPAALAGEAPEALDRPEEERRLAAAERRLARLGRVNPLALEEFAALEQRQVFLGEQLADLHRTRADLLKIVDDLDVRMREIFSAAFADTEAAFAGLFPVLFPGGSGRLSLTDAAPGEEPGIEVAVRPEGKKIERLSLLSGGERSLAAIAFLLAIFTARPSPFYILDEVEAALDDANLGRLLQVVSSLRNTSQLILITHQKRTMEIADALYGVSMRQDGVSAVVGQRLAQRA